jgi:hypothetical protein
MQKTADILRTFDSISLKEIESKKLMRRFDTKFKFHIKKLPEFLERISEEYSVLEINNTRLHKYESLYFDTENFLLFIQHHNIKRNRFKIRFRHYADSNQTFFEIKQKNNKNFTIKERIEQQCIENVIQNEAGDFLIEKTNMAPEIFLPKLWVYYSRITLVNKTAEERLTIDVNPSFAINGTSVSFEPLVIAEVKQTRHIRSPFINVMKEQHINVESISKYCMGIYLTQENIKKNVFKHNLLSINKLCHEKN